MKKKKPQTALSPLENAVMKIVWDRQPLSAEDVREHMEASHGLKSSTVRTLLRRLEAKGYVEHDVDGRTFIYREAVPKTNVATSAVRAIVDRFCLGSVENLLVGLVDDKQIAPQRLQELANQIAAAEEKKKKKQGSSRRRKRR